MNSIKISLKNNKKYFKIAFILLILGFFIGFILSTKLDFEVILEQIKSIGNYLNTNKINFILNHILTLLILFISSITIIGLLLLPLNIIYEGICISLNIISFTKAFKINGFIYGLIYSVLTKAIYLILLIIISKKLITLTKNIFNRKDKTNKKVIIIKNLKQICIYSIILILNDILIYLVGNKVLSTLLLIIR